MPALFNFTKASIQLKYNETINYEVPLAPRDELSSAVNNGDPNLTGAPLWPWIYGQNAEPTFFVKDTFYNGGDNSGNTLPFNPHFFFGWFPDLTFQHALGNIDPACKSDQWNFYAFADITGYGINGDPGLGYSYVSMVLEKNRVNPFAADVWCNKVVVNIPALDGTLDWSNIQGIIQSWGSILAVCRKI